MLPTEEPDTIPQRAEEMTATFAGPPAAEPATELATLEFLERADFFDRLASPEERDKAFRKNIIKSYSVMLDDLDEVRNHLMNVMSSEPYDWFGLPEIDKKLKEMAEYKYNETGCDEALEKIDNMDVADVKEYLKRLIKDNMVVGMEIIKGK